jgi:hypothetical protein
MIKYSVVTTSHGNKHWAKGGKAEMSLTQATKVAKTEHADYQSNDIAARIEVVAIKDNGQLGETVAAYFAIPMRFFADK